MSENKLVFMDDTKFIFGQNFSGNPERSKFGAATRQGCIVIPSEKQAMDLREKGVKVGEYEDDKGNFYYFANFVVNYNSKWPPRIYLVSPSGRPSLLDEDTVGRIDDIRVKNVNATFTTWRKSEENYLKLYVKDMYVEQYVDEDRYRDRYIWDEPGVHVVERRVDESEDLEDNMLPF